VEIFNVYLSSTDIILIAVNALVATSLFMTMVAGVFSIGQVAFMAIGAYGFGYASATLEWSPSAAIAGGAVIACVVSFLIALPLLRVSGIYLAIITIAMIRIVQLAVVASPSLGGPGGLYAELGTSAKPAWIILALALTASWAAMRLPMGKALRTLGEDEELARSLGVYTPGVKIVVFVIGGMLAGLSGALYARSTGWIGPDLFNVDRAIQVVLFAVVGGFGSALSPALGAAALTFLTIATRNLGEWQAVGFGVVVLIGIILRPQGVLDGINRRFATVYRGLRKPAAKAAP
jgi:branched-chain amino acid transport system permease protein